ncbi:hypothetical protein GBW32_19690 [Streptomyces tsukubensis]|uniref:Uncharacterized protein n=1 Tax=Streptomyces tsukubensis TaxID=83656 RepID=A0A1V4AB10_9ACTN|nr:hypothetical protein [Streptomyces tsukubensis]OON81016.1 hypothetical protein B1H18_09320 [Streptomyces tsukubensis]QFR94853.1 hypothetical protein GBW32_19690 [Streptomyces tsukubensis]
MPTSGVSAGDIAARLSALGLTPHVERHASFTSIKAEVPASYPAESWRGALEALAKAHRFGLRTDSSYGSTLWAAVRTTAPATGDVRGPGHQR